MTITTLLSKLESVKQNGNGWMALCPAHPDKEPSLSVKVGNNGKILLRCFAQCSFEAITAALNITAADLAPEDNRPAPSSSSKKRKGKIAATYDYLDEKETLLYQAVRFEPKDFKQRRPDPDAKDGWAWNLNGVRRVLYRLPSLLAAIKVRETVFLCEGEKDVENLRRWGLAATTNAMGAGKWCQEYTDTLRGAEVILLPDNDEPGRKHAQSVACALHGVAASVRVLELPGLPDGGDVSNWMEAGGTREELLRLAQEAPEWTQAAGVPSKGIAVDAASDDRYTKGDEWPTPTPLYDFRPPPFPTNCLPSWIRRFVEATADATQTPPDLAGMVSLSVCATAVTKRARIVVREGWSEPLNIWTLTVLPSGSRKSAVVDFLTAPLRQFEREENDRLGPDVEGWRSERAITELKRKNEERRAADMEKTSEDARMEAESNARNLARKLATIQEPNLLQLLADDATPEALCRLMAEQDGRIAILSAEGSPFDMMAGRYSENGPNLDVYLKGHAGDELRVNRIGRTPIYIAQPALTLGLAVQPDILQGLVKQPSFRGRGLLGRFLYALPISNLGYRSIHPPPVPSEVTATYHAGVRALLHLHPSEDDQGQPAPHALDLTTEAISLFDSFQERVEMRLRPGGQFEFVSDWAGKLCGAVARVAGNFHLAGHIHQADPWNVPVSAETMSAAIRLADDYLVPHALHAFIEMGADPETDGARALLAWMKRERCPEFSQRDAQNKNQSRFPKVEMLQAPLKTLTEHGYIREIAQERAEGQKGRSPSPLYEVNPAIHREK